MAAISAVLALYDADLIREVTDPRTGIMTTEKYMTFMPNAGELKVYCEGVAARKQRMQHLGSLPRPDFTQARLEAPEPPDGNFAHVFVPENHPRYATLVEWSAASPRKFWKFGKSSDGRSGIWVAHGVWDPDPTFLGSIGSAAAKLVNDLRQSEAAE